MFKRRIYTVVEVKERELLAKILFAIQMAKKDYSIVLGKKNSLFNYSKLLQTGIFFFKGMGKNNIEPMKKLKKVGHKIVGFDEEGLVMNQVETIPGRINKDCLNMVEYFFTVGKKQKKNTLKVYPKFKNKVHEIGNSRFDLLKKKNRNYFNDEIKNIKAKYGKFVLFPSKFTILNNALFPGIPKSLKKGPGRFVLEKDYEDQKIIEKKLKKFFKYFPKRYPNIKIIIKPHPIENKNYWNMLIKKINSKNLILADEIFTTNSYIMASEFNVGSNCHTSLESYLCNKPTINLRPSKKDGYIINKLIRAVSGKEVLEVKELEKIIVNWFFKSKKFNNKITKKNLKILNYNIKNVKKDASFYFEKKINQIKIKEKNKDKFSNYLFLKFFEFVRRFKNIYYSFLTSKKKQSYQGVKFSSLTLEEFENYTSKTLKNLNMNSKNFSVKEIYPGCFCIEKN